MTTILVADDHQDIRELTRLHLFRHGYCVNTAKNGLEAIESAKASRPSLILMDLNMPQIDGWDCIVTLKRDAHLQEVPIIALTAYCLPGDKIRALNAGCEAFHSKPIDYMALLADIERLIPKS